MPFYQLTYARTVILTTKITAENEDEAFEKASQLEAECKLGVDFGTLENTLYIKEGSDLEDIADEDAIWDIERVYE
jgi:hypothetical protein